MSPLFDDYLRVRLYPKRRPLGWKVSLGLGAAVFFLMIAAACTQHALQAKSMDDPDVQFLVESDLRRFPSFSGAVSTMRCIYSANRFEVDIMGDTPAKPNSILVVRDGHLITKPACALLGRHRERGIHANPAHADFGPTSLAHEFGHHRNGDLFVTAWPLPFDIFQNTVFDFRIDIPIWERQLAGACEIANAGPKR